MGYSAFVSCWRQNGNTVGSTSVFIDFIEARREVF
jgi:hypothetical protein